MAYDPDLADRVRAILERQRGFSEREMFGGVCFMIGGRMCCGVVKTDLMVRLAPDKVKAALRRPHTRPMEFTGKPLKSMIFLDGDGTENNNDLREWIELALAFVRTLPPKK